MVKLLVKSEHKEIFKKILYKWKKYKIKYYKIPNSISIIKLLIFSFILVIPFYPVRVNYSDIYENSTNIWKINFVWNNDFYLDNLLLNNKIISIESEYQLIEPSIFSTCNNSQNPLSKNETLWKNKYLINLSFDKNCDNPNIFIRNWDKIYTKTQAKINLITYAKLFDEYTNYDSNKIKELIKEEDNNIWIWLYEWIERNRIIVYKKSILSQILKTRWNLKYLIPVAGKEIPTRPNIIPNAPRPYRANYTDWVHHWWDLFAARWTPVRSISDGIIYRIRNDFSWWNFDKILWQNLTNKDRLINLDIYRWNQVWIKTADWNITIYSHLESIPQNLQEWQVVKEWDYLWQVWRSWVPDKEYTDFHLHFEIQVNPYNNYSPSLLDVMRWNFWWKGKKYEDIIEWQKKIFK